MLVIDNGKTIIAVNNLQLDKRRINYRLIVFPLVLLWIEKVL